MMVTTSYVRWHSTQARWHLMSHQRTCYSLIFSLLTDWHTKFKGKTLISDLCGILTCFCLKCLGICGNIRGIREHEHQQTDWDKRWLPRHWWSKIWRKREANLWFSQLTQSCQRYHQRFLQQQKVTSSGAQPAGHWFKSLMLPFLS